MKTIGQKIAEQVLTVVEVDARHLEIPQMTTFGMKFSPGTDDYIAESLFRSSAAAEHPIARLRASLADLIDEEVKVSNPLETFLSEELDRNPNNQGYRSAIASILIWAHRAGIIKDVPQEVQP